MDKKITFLQAYEAFIEEKINFLKPNASAERETEDEKRKKDGATAAAAMVMEQQQREISHFAEHGFNSRDDFYDFADKLKDKEYMAAFDAMSDEEKTKTANRFFDDLDKAVDEKKISTSEAEEIRKLPEIRHLREFTGQQNNREQEASPSFTAGLSNEIEKLNDHELAEQARILNKGVQGSDSRTSNEIKMVLAGSLGDGINSLAEDNGIANHKAEFESSEQDDFAIFETQVASVAKQLQETGVEDKTGVAASKPTEVQIADNATKDHSKGAAV